MITAMASWLVASILFLIFLSPSYTLSALPAMDDQICNVQPYQVHIFSKSPLLIYIEDFVSEAEATNIITLR
jgi:hypothetical protein